MIEAPDLCEQCKHEREWPDCESSDTHYTVTEENQFTNRVMMCASFEPCEEGQD